MKNIYLAVFFLLLRSEVWSQAQNNSVIPTIDCKTKAAKVSLAFRGIKGQAPWNKEIELPASGRFVEEAHYVTNKDVFEGKSFPESVYESIDEHLRRSFQVYQKFDSTVTRERLYGRKPQWTPPEGGKAGQGALGNDQLKKLRPEDELWLMNMMWARGAKPIAGSKYLLSLNGRNVVVAAGYETGPQSPAFLGGVTREVHKWLRANNNSVITVGFLEDQTVSTGPCNCK